MERLSRKEFITLTNKEHGLALEIHTNCGTVTLCQKLDDVILSAPMFSLDWLHHKLMSRCISSGEEYNKNSENSQNSKLYPSRKDAVEALTSDRDQYTKYLVMHDEELETFARCYPHDNLYIYVIPAENPEEFEEVPKKRRKRKTKTAETQTETQDTGPNQSESVADNAEQQSDEITDRKEEILDENKF
jgi:hypothetical protein